MRFHFPSLITGAKSLLIEGLALAGAFLSDAIIQSNADWDERIRVAMNVRVYYLSKNIFYLLDSLLISQDNKFSQLYNGSFNLAVGLTIYPASKLFPKYAVSPQHTMGTQAIVYGVGLSLRALIEPPFESQTIKQHILQHKGKLAGGAAGVLLSALPSARISSPALYWSGELVDAWHNNTGSLLSLLLSTKATVPIQAFFSQIIKTSTQLGNHSLALPVFALDSVIASSHLLMITTLGGCKHTEKNAEEEEEEEGIAKVAEKQKTNQDPELGEISTAAQGDKLRLN